MASSKIIFDRDFIAKCQTNAPRYTSYPTADRFDTDFNQVNQINHVKSVFTEDACDLPVSLYIHIPFCNTLCLYCGCNKIITNDRSNIGRYLKYLERELNLYYQLIGKKLKVVQLHFGGGSPSWLSIAEIEELMKIIRDYFDLDNAKEIAMEIDPRHTDNDFILALNDNQFNRISIGLQDLDPKVQKAVNRTQTFAQSNAILEYAKKLGFVSTNIDLIYGLPLQNVQSFGATIDQVILMNPERIALFNYAHIPNLFMPQTRILESDLPSAEEKLDILQMSVERLLNAQYEFIGLDHFAKSDDDLAIALKNGSLQRNFQGYSTFSDTNLLGFGVSAIGFVGNSYYQNSKHLQDYYGEIDNGRLPILRGIVLDQDDLLRREIIQKIMCQFKLDFTVVAEKYDIKFSDYFAKELIELKNLAMIGLVEIYDDGVIVSDRGRFLLRNVAMVFDKYLHHAKAGQYSKVI